MQNCVKMCGICHTPGNVAYATPLPPKAQEYVATPCVAYATQAGAPVGWSLGHMVAYATVGKSPPPDVAYATVGKSPPPDVAYATVGHGVAYATPAWTPLGS